MTYLKPSCFLMAICALLAPACADPEKSNSSQHGDLASEISWRGIMGAKEGDKTQVHVLMAQGFMGCFGLSSPTFAEDMEEQIANWLKAHPQAWVVPVQTIPLGDDLGFLYCWLVDGDENLNVLLVRHGCCTSEHMLTPFGEDDLQVPREEYQAFAKAVADAEQAAISEKRGVWALEQFKAESHWVRAEDLEKRGLLPDAILQFKEAMESGHDRGSAWFRIAKCYDQLGDYQAALAAYDQAITEDADPFRDWMYFDKAKCVSKHEGLEKAATMLRELIAQSPDNLNRRQMLAMLYAGEKQYAQGVDTLAEGVALFRANRGIEFDQDNHIVWKESESRFGDLQELAFGLTQLAQIHLAAGNYDSSFACATKGLSIRQEIKRHSVGRHSPATIEAGDVDSRLIRAKVFMHRSKFDDAKAEIDQAEHLIDVGDLQGPRVKQMIEEAYADLRRQASGKESAAGKSDNETRQDRGPVPQDE